MKESNFPSFVRSAEIKKKTGWSDATINRKIKAGLFPTYYKLADGSKMWLESELLEWATSFTSQEVKHSAQ
ncbi:hypothetical protein BM524_18220 [Alteromonas mediterranea]|uniref:AlpA family phage regulatory protein n=1 Tax=Alteromonas mediterranea TaxID=314275 RepID=A0AAC9NSC6_9ALTE|nr:AlpA family phage regulatory protein [Alteromonas mediterranea]APD91575.1 hypothetical protein BM524_18220 [Alteromonas mediterranea]|tara:strand:+ start:3151 stop:3363 length:213 start_codon:yes stop_codon:yes gene_type:complete